MAAVSRCLGSLTLLLAGTDGARISRKHSSAPNSKFIAGIPVLNYHTAYGGKASLGESESMEEQGWVVMLKPGTSDAKVKDLCQANKKGCKFAGHPTGGVPFFEMTGTESDLKAVLESAGSAARYAEPDGQVSMIPEIEAGPEAATWGLNRVGADERDYTGAGSTVFVLDTGVRVSHQEFGGRAVPSLDMTIGDPVECNGDLNCAGDRQGHGTHCAGTAGGETFGVAPGAAVRSIKVLSDQGSGSWSWSYYALDWLAVHPTRPAVASMSLGGSGNQQAMVDAVDAAVNGGVTVVVAGGNENTDACTKSPAFVPSAITVGSTTSTDTRSSFSNYGSCTNIWAPGSSVLSASSTSDTGSRTLSGTSMACPHVSGGAALVLEMSPSLRAPQVLAELTNAGEKDALTGLTSNDVNVLLNVREFYTGPPTPAPPTPAPPPPGTWELTGSGCQMQGDCINSLNYPNNYGDNEACNVQLWGDIPLRFDAFDTESSYDILTVGGTAYSGTSGPASGSYSGSLNWASDYSVTKSGWKLCRTDGSSPTPPGPSPTPAPTTPAPTTPAPTPAPPSPPSPTPGNCSSWCEPPSDCVDYPFSCSDCCDGSPTPPSPPAPSPPPSDCNDICDRCSDVTEYPTICGGCDFC